MSSIMFALFWLHGLLFFLFSRISAVGKKSEELPYLNVSIEVLMISEVSSARLLFGTSLLDCSRLADWKSA